MRTCILSLLSLAIVAGASAAPVPKAAKKRPDAEVFVGTWETVPAESKGRAKTDAVYEWTIDADLTMWSKLTGSDGKGSKWAIKIDPEASPKQIDLKLETSSYQGIYEIDGDEIRILYGVQRPTNFDDKGKAYHTVLRRVKDGGK